MKRFGIDYSVKLNEIAASEISAVTPCSSLSSSVGRRNAGAITAFFKPIRAAKKLAQRIKFENAYHIKTVENLREFKNCVSDSWSHDIIYIEHPMKKYALIPENEYKEYILREMMADIAQYVVESMAIKQITIGLVVSGHIGQNVTVPVEELVVNAEKKCKISRDYSFTLKDVPLKKEKSEHPWIGKFPDVKKFADMRAGHMEIISEMTVTMEVGAGVVGLVGLKRDAEVKYKFYIFYEAQK